MAKADIRFRGRCRTAERLSTARPAREVARGDNAHRRCGGHNDVTLFPKSRPNPRRKSPRDPTRRVGTKEKATIMTEQEKRRAAEREEIAARVASFRATQEKFERERDEYFTATLQNARGV
jgi:hypothetical protein